MAKKHTQKKARWLALDFCKYRLDIKPTYTWVWQRRAGVSELASLSARARAHTLFERAFSHRFRPRELSFNKNQRLSVARAMLDGMFIVQFLLLPLIFASFSLSLFLPRSSICTYICFPFFRLDSISLVPNDVIASVFNGRLKSWKSNTIIELFARFAMDMSNIEIFRLSLLQHHRWIERVCEIEIERNRSGICTQNCAHIQMNELWTKKHQLIIMLRVITKFAYF